MAGAVQFYGKEQVLAAYDNMEGCAWAIYHSGRNLFMKYEGSDGQESDQLMQQALELLERNMSDAIYTIKFFEVEEGKKTKINERTICDAGSFNFKIVTPEAREQKQIGYYSAAQNIAYEKKIWELEQKLAASKVKEEPETIGGFLMELARNPDDLGQLVNIGRVLCGFEPKQLGSIGSITKNVQDNTESAMEENAQDLSTSIDILNEADPHFIKRMKKLAALAKSDPEGFKAKASLIDLL